MAETPVEIQSDDMVSVLINEFLGSQKVPANIYIRIGGNKYVQILKAGDEIQLERFQQYLEREVDKLFVMKGDLKLLVDQSLSIGGILLTRAEIANPRKIQILNQMSKVVFDQMDAVGFSGPMYNHARILTKATVDLVEAKPVLADLLQSLSNSSSELVAHSISVSAISVMIAKAMGWSVLATLEKVALGGMLHDIGLKELPPELLKRPRSSWSYEELQVYESHPFRAVKVMQSMGVVPDDVISVVYEHHEDCAGQGFPRNMKAVRIHPLAKVVGLADTFSELIFQSVNNPVARIPKEALGFIERTMGQPYQKEAFRALQEIVLGKVSSTKAA